eukprot:gnl/TRDRNA2_/TRDRNA2_149790_c0_seq1.p1 gnl/TRDRNA2_/TRDRNA2_149790_c0~~gnl/TRDRNA2_/TRDRNA2_149790_c0_seq1.p1  ORF type:complete len:273 (+),score=60.86 gnl/TRDRNA2_/TRDRNA2_149790_c0_seq1:67-819(+)
MYAAPYGQQDMYGRSTSPMPAASSTSPMPGGYGFGAEKAEYGFPTSGSFVASPFAYGAPTLGDGMGFGRTPSYRDLLGTSAAPDYSGGLMGTYSPQPPSSLFGAGFNGAGGPSGLGGMGLGGPSLGFPGQGLQSPLFPGGGGLGGPGGGFGGPGFGGGGMKFGDWPDMGGGSTGAGMSPLGPSPLGNNDEAAAGNPAPKTRGLKASDERSEDDRRGPPGTGKEKPPRGARPEKKDASSSRTKKKVGGLCC